MKITNKWFLAFFVLLPVASLAIDIEVDLTSDQSLSYLLSDQFDVKTGWKKANDASAIPPSVQELSVMVRPKKIDENIPFEVRVLFTNRNGERIEVPLLLKKSTVEEDGLVSGLVIFGSAKSVSVFDVKLLFIVGDAGSELNRSLGKTTFILPITEFENDR